MGLRVVPDYALRLVGLGPPGVLDRPAAATEVKRKLLYLLASVLVNDELSNRHPAVQAGVGMILRGGWARVGCGRVLDVHG